METARAERTTAAPQATRVPAPPRSSSRAVSPAIRSALLRDAPPALRLGPGPAPAAPVRPGELPAAVAALINAPGIGDALDGRVRSSLETSLDVDLAPVRVHA